MTRVLGIDGSTNTFAYGIVEGDKLHDYGEFHFDGSRLETKLASARHYADELSRMDFDKVYIEATVYINNRQVVIKLSQFAGVLYSSFGVDNVKINTVIPIHWQKHIGNGSFTKEEKAELRKNNKGKSKSWLRNERRRVRKQRTIDYVAERYGVVADNDNIGDAIAIAAYGWDKEQ